MGWRPSDLSWVDRDAWVDINSCMLCRVSGVVCVSLFGGAGHIIAVYRVVLVYVVVMLRVAAFVLVAWTSTFSVVMLFVVGSTVGMCRASELIML